MAALACSMFSLLPINSKMSFETRAVAALRVGGMARNVADAGRVRHISLN
jgi:hypothetical protein